MGRLCVHELLIALLGLRSIEGMLRGRLRSRWCVPVLMIS